MRRSTLRIESEIEFLQETLPDFPGQRGAGGIDLGGDIDGLKPQRMEFLIQGFQCRDQGCDLGGLLFVQQGKTLKRSLCSGQ